MPFKDNDEDRVLRSTSENIELIISDKEYHFIVNE